MEAFDAFIRDSRRGKRRLASGRKISPGTIKAYEQTLRMLLEISIIEIRVPTIIHMRTHSPELLRKHMRTWKAFAKQLREYFWRNGKYSDTYIHLHFKNLKTFFHYMERERGWRLGTVGACFSFASKSIVPVVLSPAQIDFLISNRDFLERLNRTKQRIRIIFLLGCFSGLRFSDLMLLRKTNLIQANGRVCLRLVTQKTGQVLEIPLPEEAIILIKQLKRNRTVYLLPRISNVNFNIQIKQLIALAGWDYTYPKYQCQRGRLIEMTKEDGRSWRFYEHITAHTMRRTAITTLLRLGVSENLVRAISGHAPGSKEFYKYVHLSQTWVDQEVLEAWRHLKSDQGSL